jgi:hypothetical protein
MVIVHSYVSLPEGTLYDLQRTATTHQPGCEKFAASLPAQRQVPVVPRRHPTGSVRRVGGFRCHGRSKFIDI